MKKYYLLGEKLGHSYSAELHRANGLCYELKELPPNDLGNFLRERNFDGLNVTMPYKKAVVPFLDEIRGAAKELGSVNTIAVEDGRLIGYNTDFFGMDYALKSVGIDPTNKNVVVLGGGGAGVTAKTLAEKRGAKSVTVVSRSGEVDYEKIYEFKDTEIIINATPVGMFPNVCETPLGIGADKFPKLSVVFDCVYNPLRTELVLSAARRGVKCCGGLKMLVAQGLYSEQIWGECDSAEEKIESAYKSLLTEKRNIVLIGMPGAGKTTVGKALAKELTKSFIDTDGEITKRTGKSPEEIIERFGEARFREIESEVSVELARTVGAVIATGGGTFLNEKNASAFSRQGIVIYIERPLDLLEQIGRPISKSQSISRLFAQREQIYLSHCDVKISNDSTVPACVRKIRKSIEEYC